MTSNMSFAGKTAMEEVLEPSLMTVGKDKKSDSSAMIDVPKDTQGLVLTVIKYALQALEMMDSTAEKLNTEEELGTLGNLVMD